MTEKQAINTLEDAGWHELKLYGGDFFFEKENQYIHLYNGFVRITGAFALNSTQLEAILTLCRLTEGG